MHLILLFLALFSLLEAKHCTFVPPTDWEIAHLKKASPFIKIGFIGKGSTDFRPSINLATEEVDVSLKEYVKAVKELQMGDPQTKWRDLGVFQMKGGAGKLVEMTNSSPYGEMKVLQAFLLKDQKAYILTAAVLKDDFAKLQSELLKSFRSLDLISDIWSPIADRLEREKFQQLFTSLGTHQEKETEWQQLQEEVQTNSSLGPYWQFMALQEGRAKIYPSADLQQ